MWSIKRDSFLPVPKRNISRNSQDINRILNRAIGELVIVHDHDPDFQKLISKPIHKENSKKIDLLTSRVYTNIKTHLSSNDLNVVTDALKSLNKKCIDPERSYHIAKSGFAEKLKELLYSEKDSVRQESLSCLRKLYTTAVDVINELVIDINFLEKLKEMMNDPSKEIRKQVSLFLEQISNSYSHELLSMSYIPEVLAKLNKEDDEIICNYLEMLKNLVKRADKNDVICNWKSWKSFLLLLENDNPTILKLSLKCLSELVSSPVGKCLVCEGKLLNKVASLLSHKDKEVVSAAAKTIMEATIGGLIKFKFKNSSSLINRCVELCYSSNYDTKLFCMRTLTHICDFNDGSKNLVKEKYLFQIENIPIQKKDQMMQIHKKELLDVLKNK